MAARALAAAVAVGGGRRMVSAGSRIGPAPLLASSRSGGSRNQYCSASASAQPDPKEVVDGGTAMTGPQVEAALNSKNVEVLQDEEERVGTEKSTLGAGVVLQLEGEADASTWVPDQETGVFGPADAADSTASTHVSGAPHSATFTGGSSSVLDQTVFVREEDMEDVERPAMANADADAGSSNN